MLSRTLLVNIDKKEIITPYDFNEGAKLLEFGGSQDGTMLGLALLLADGNGRGGGDLYCNTCLNDRCEAFSKKRDFRVDSKFKHPDGHQCKLVVPKIVGTWAGDRIVITGDYADKGKFVGVERPFTEKEKEKVREYFSSGDFKRTDDINLYALANIKGYKNISKKVINAMKMDIYLGKTIKDRQARMK